MCTERRQACELERCSLNLTHLVPRQKNKQVSDAMKLSGCGLPTRNTATVDLPNKELMQHKETYALLKWMSNELSSYAPPHNARPEKNVLFSGNPRMGHAREMARQTIALHIPSHSLQNRAPQRRLTNAPYSTSPLPLTSHTSPYSMSLRSSI